MSANSSPIKSHRYNLGLIGNCAFNALIDTNANIKWMCWPRFDSSFIFGSLLDDDKGGEFSIQPATDSFKSSQSYIENTNILSTRFESSDGSFEVIDFAPRFDFAGATHRPLMLLRKVKRLSGQPRIAVKCRPVGDYGKIVPERLLEQNQIRFEGLGESVSLISSAYVANNVFNENAFELKEDLCLVLSYGTSFEGPLESTFEDLLNRTEKHWHLWIKSSRLPGVFQKDVIRSALTLKLHQYEETGATIASVTTSLPEIDQEGRNWDYRFCWMRDTYYTLAALKELGYTDEMKRYAGFIKKLENTESGSLQPCYRIDATAKMTEIIEDLRGYKNNQPVRVGNQAGSQIQHDVYGQVLLSLLGLQTDSRETDSVVALAKNLLNSIERTMEEPDNGVWEFRGKQSMHTYTLMFHWAGGVAAKKIAESIKDSELAIRADKIVTQAASLIEGSYSPTKKAYAQAVGSDEMDACMLQLISMGYLDGKNPEVTSKHLEAIRKELEISPGFLLRYKHTDDFGVQRSAFLVCSFWYIEALAHMGRADEAKALLEKVIATQNHVGLMSEDYDVENDSQWGNFPQTYSHAGLISCAFTIDRAMNTRTE
ncbi:glycoside hydrolase family 15 protein [Bdellovibrio sp. HCB290]|uniref:glycoside hydrolase family 15 protein n=1 Tax=Bdellovibrio sp. HCB290 TaxID=3394356 RepID=UPI0039B5334B